MRNELVIALTLAAVGSTPAAATSLDVNLDFAAFNQSQWSPGPAVNEDVQYRFPDPCFGATANLARVSLDPVGTLLDFVGDFLGMNLVTGVSIAPTATFTTGFDAGYHVNSGALSQSTTRRRSAFTCPRRTFSSTRRRRDAFVGLVGRRGRATVAARATSACRRASASSRFFSRLRCRWALMTTTPSALTR